MSRPYHIALRPIRVFLGLGFVLFSCNNLQKENHGKQSRWSYVNIDSTRTPLQGKQEGAWCFGFAVGDVTGDGFPDIASCQWIYINPGGEQGKPWQRAVLPEEMDAMLMLDINADGKDEIIALGCGEQYLLELNDAGNEGWQVIRIGNLPICDHGISTQGYTMGQIIPGGLPELVFNSGGEEGTVYVLHIPENWQAGDWPYDTLIFQTGLDKGMAIGDIDHDGRQDLVTAVLTQDTTYQINWFRNEAGHQSHWQPMYVGNTINKPDRYAITDLNGDGKSDIVVTEGRWPGDEPDANLFWFEQTDDQWIRHRVLTQYSINSLSVADLDSNQTPDLVIAEHKGPFLRVQVLKNDSHGNFEVQTISQGKENHIGARLFDADRDGDLDIAGFGWTDYENVHLWINNNQ